jgi:hypothetical protein
MKTLFTCCCLACLLLSAGAQNKTPLNRAFLQSNMDGNGFSLTNLFSLQVGTVYGSGAGLSNVTASATYPTNAGTQLITFGNFVEYRDFQTNAAFAFTGFTGVSSTNVQTVVYFVTNSLGTVWDVTPPPGMLATNGTWKTTNVTAFTFVNNGKKWTNGAAYPIR